MSNEKGQNPRLKLMVLFNQRPLSFIPKGINDEKVVIYETKH